MYEDDIQDSAIVEQINKRDATQINRSRHRTSTNSDYTKCQCECPSLPIGFTVLEPKNVLCQKCGGHIV